MNTVSDRMYEKVYRLTDDAIHGFFEEYRFLSNFEICDIEYDGMVFPSTENAYQAAKLPKALRKKFQDIAPNDAKNLGRSLKMNSEQLYEWEQKKVDIMREVCKYKFFNHPELAKKLMETGKKYLEETNYWNDCFYGGCKGYGLNHLGRILMNIRTELVDQGGLENGNYQI